MVVEPDMRYGYDFNQYEAKQLKIKRGDTFGAILERNGIDYPEVYTILQAIKGKVSVRKLQIGKPYTLLFSKDSVLTPKAFIYHPDALGYSVIQLRDSIYGKQVNKPIRTVELEATGVIESCYMKPCSTADTTACSPTLWPMSMLGPLTLPA